MFFSDMVEWIPDGWRFYARQQAHDESIVIVSSNNLSPSQIDNISAKLDESAESDEFEIEGTI